MLAYADFSRLRLWLLLTMSPDDDDFSMRLPNDTEEKLMDDAGTDSQKRRDAEEKKKEKDKEIMEKTGDAAKARREKKDPSP